MESTNRSLKYFTFFYPYTLKIFQLFFFANYYIAFCAAFLSFQVFFLMGTVNYLTLAEIFFCTNAIYLLHNILGSSFIPDSYTNTRILFLKKNYRILLFLFLISFLIAVILFFCMTKEGQIIILLILIPSIAYVYPLFGNKRLRDIPYLKVFLTSFIWTVLTVLLPFSTIDNGFNANLNLLLLEKFFFLFSLSLLFDVRDIELEKKSGVSTFASKFGKRATVLLAVLFQSVWLALNWLHYSFAICAAMTFVYLVFVALSILCMKQQRDLYYIVILDGIMLFQPLMFIISSKIQ
jgi:hypothetical protein